MADFLGFGTRGTADSSTLSLCCFSLMRQRSLGLTSKEHFPLFPLRLFSNARISFSLPSLLPAPPSGPPTRGTGRGAPTASLLPTGEERQREQVEKLKMLIRSKRRLTDSLYNERWQRQKAKRPICSNGGGVLMHMGRIYCGQRKSMKWVWDDCLTICT